MRKKIVFALILLIVLANLSVFAGCSSIELDNGLSIKESAVIMSNDILSEKLNKNFVADINKELYDFTGEFNYLYCYNEELDYYAIYNMDSGKIMERSNGNIYDGFLNYKCYYGGYGSYFFEKDNMLCSVTDNSFTSIDDAITYFNEYSTNLMQASIEDSQYKSREDIKTYVEQVLYQDGVVISKCGESNRPNSHYIDDYAYFSFELANNFYADPSLTLSDMEYCYVDGYKIGFNEYSKYYGERYYDTIFPINQSGSCGFVAATMLLQFYDRQWIVKTIPNTLYDKARNTLFQYKFYSSSEVLSEILHNELIRLNNGKKGTYFIELKDVIKKYFATYNMSGLSATSSLGYAGIKAAIDNDDPCVADIRQGAKIYIMSKDFQDFEKDDSGKKGHIVLVYGYTLDNLGILDEFIFHTGWDSDNAFNSVAFVSKLFIDGNVRLLY